MTNSSIDGRLLPKAFKVSRPVLQSLRSGQPVVALESTVITHGLPHPENLNIAQGMESEVRSAGGTPATIGVIEGKIRIGLDESELEQIATRKSARKISVRDFSLAIARREMGGTTVAGTLFAAHKAGIRVFATGGIGGVHREPKFDISADLNQLARFPLIVVCAGAKAILDLPATLEYLETAGIPVVGYQTDEFPAFYSAESGLPVQVRCDTVEEIVALSTAHWELGFESAILVTVPPPDKVALSFDAMEQAINEALARARSNHIRGQALTPYLLEQVSKLTGGASLQANLGLLRNNARVATRIAQALSRKSSSSAYI